jgi:hypothetical protein
MQYVVELFGVLLILHMFTNYGNKNCGFGGIRTVHVVGSCYMIFNFCLPTLHNFIRLNVLTINGPLKEQSSFDLIETDRELIWLVRKLNVFSKKNPAIKIFFLRVNVFSNCFEYFTD